ncbi:hypothetical protein VPH35_012629 [Triticum aestivum]
MPRTARPSHATPSHKYHHHTAPPPPTTQAHPHPLPLPLPLPQQPPQERAGTHRIRLFLPRGVVSDSEASDMANAASGMAVDDECKLKFLELKAKRTHRFIIYKIDDKKKMVVVEKVGEPALNYEDFAASLPTNECRYAIFDYDFVTEENCQKSKIFFVAWSPDTARVRSKMIYASSKERFKRELDGIQVELQATDPTEVGFDVIQGRAN